MYELRPLLGSTSLLGQAVQYGHSKVSVALIVNAGADFEESTPPLSYSRLHEAALCTRVFGCDNISAGGGRCRLRGE